MRDPVVSFSAVGDISLGDHPLCVGFGAYSRFKTEAAGFPFERVERLLRDRDVVFGNLECTISRAGGREGVHSSVQMRGEPGNLQGLVDAGFDVLNVANNHSMQHGKKAFLETLELLGRQGISCCGVGDDDQWEATPAIISRKGLTVGFLGYSLRPRQYFDHAPLYAEGLAEGIERDVRRVRGEADVVVVSLHWGDEFIRRPSPEEIALARGVIDAGADLIIGHHPHVLRGIEHYKSGCIVYSLGNFVCDMVWDRALRETAILSCKISREGVHDVELLPMRINDDYQPEPMLVAEGEALLAEIEKLSRGFGSEPAAVDASYERDADEALRSMRRRSQLFFLSRLWRYPPRALIQILGVFLGNRLQEFGPKS